MNAKHLTITISGSTGSGKTLLALKVFEFLKNEGVHSIKVVDDIHYTANQVSPIFNLIKPMTDITIKTEQQITQRS